MSENKNILITGGSGLIGTRLTTMLLDRGYTVSHLSRKRTGLEKIKTYQWNPSEGIIEDEAFTDIHYIIHLAGENIASHRWTKDFKKKIIDSRVQSSLLLKEKMRGNKNINAIICSSASGIYKEEGDKWVDENSSHGNGFLSQTCEQWEASNSHFPCRTVILRTGIVLSEKNGALPELMKPLRFGFAVYFGKGNFYQSWIHVDDLCRMYIYCIEHNSIQGIYNAVAPNPVTNLELTNSLRKQISKFTMLVSAPLFMLKLILGEKSVIVTNGCRMSAKKIIGERFQFLYSSIDDALKNLIGK